MHSDKQIRMAARGSGPLNYKHRPLGYPCSEQEQKRQ